ncbi:MULTISPECIES: ZIP family metal transporter [unclassified Flavobacterium]|uniref:ZIP family metal transporter n=1 Tax=unclassified Flavobacterium TaxID=196869 RepID=UPI00086870F7|nr:MULTISPECIES: ZIP family metal transporter [unclassified Flavobacterium]MBN9283021.1 ZIP family metal transporter [Flavobacterium sp.]ODS82223.1 MAG: ZIP family metal transporter [Chryseobacterium sp. SCN 40-13]OJV67655.1 MAG: ZIP family metal transporter [Flavobacterium sp. 40-81]
MLYLIPLLSVIIGYVAATFFRPKNKQNLKLLLAFSGSFLLALTVSHLLPEVYEASNHAHEGHDHAHSPVGIFIMIGIVFQIVLEYFSKGAEHGHVHGHETMHHIPWSLFISLCLHALLEGLPVSHHHDLAWGIAIHHFPIAIILTTFFINSHLNKTAIFIFMMVFASMTPLGTLLAGYLPFISEYYSQITAIVIGILFHISSTIIFESSEGHKFNMAKLTAIILGIILAYFM